MIAGVHFNWSLAEDLWPAMRRIDGQVCGLREFRDQRYMGQIRNLQRYGWLIPLSVRCLAGGVQNVLRRQDHQPAVVRRHHVLCTTRDPLRMGDIGYQNSREEGLGIKACYDDLPCYADSLHRATMTPAEAWETLGVRVGDEYRQLNANILQIENEYYSTVRPKQVLEGLEKPSLALKKRGIRYIELRSLDVNAYHPTWPGRDPGALPEVFLLFCLLAESPLIDDGERREIDRNLLDVAHRGASPD